MLLEIAVVIATIKFKVFSNLTSTIAQFSTVNLHDINIIVRVMYVFNTSCTVHIKYYNIKKYCACNMRICTCALLLCVYQPHPLLRVA